MYRSHRPQRFLALAVVAIMAASSAQAVSIGRAGGFSRPSVSFSRASPSRAPAFAAPTRAGGGQTVGMTRPDVMQRAREPVPAAPPIRRQTPVATSVVTPGQVSAATPHARGGPGWGTVVGAAAGGALLGHLMTDRHPSTTVVGGGGYGGAGIAAPAAVATAVAPVLADGAYAAAPAVTYVSSGPSAVGVLFMILGVTSLLGALAVFAWKVLKSSKEYRAGKGWEDGDTVPTWRLPFSPITTFYQVQDAFNMGDETQLRVLLGPDLVEQLLREMPNEDQRMRSGITGASFEALDVSERVISVRYRATDPKDGPIHEVWHFVPVNGAWRVNGIEQV